MLMYTLPGKRYTYYTSKTFEKIQSNVLAEVDKTIQFLGFYPVDPHYDLLDLVKDKSKNVIRLNLVFNMLNCLIIGISSILIYSLMNITAAQNKFDNGIHRLLGTSKSGTVAMILLQGVTFVLPSLLLGICCSIPLIFLL